MSQKSLDLDGVTSFEQAQRIARAMQNVGTSASTAADAFRRAAQSLGQIVKTPEQVLREKLIEAAESEDGRARIPTMNFRDTTRLEAVLHGASRAGLVEIWREVMTTDIIIVLTDKGRELVSESVEARRIKDIEADRDDVFSNRRSIQLED